MQLLHVPLITSIVSPAILIVTDSLFPKKNRSVSFWGYCIFRTMTSLPSSFCNSFSFIRFPVSSRKKINRAIAEQKAFWNTLSYKQQMERYAKAVKEQQELNEQLASEGLINEVNDDWEETEKSPTLQD